MVDNLNFLVAPLLLALFGLPAAFDPRLRRATPALRYVLAFMVGTIAYVVWATVLSTVGIAWSHVSITLPLGLLSLAGTYALSRRDNVQSDEPDQTNGAWRAVAIIVGFAGATHLVLYALTGHATSIDFFYFWSVKALEFAEAGGIDAAYLSSDYSVHAHAPYPPMVPVVSAWGVDLVGRLPWRAGLVSSAMWIVLAFPVVLRSLRSRLPASDATLASGVWLFGISLAFTSSASAGNAEAPLVFFLTIAVAVLLGREATFPAWVVPAAVCGIVLTKSEGVVLWGLLVVGVAVGALVEKKTPSVIARRLSGMVLAPAGALGTWIVFELANGLPLSDPAREEIGVISFDNLAPALAAMFQNLEAGSAWFGWGIAVLVLASCWRSWRTVLPGLAVAVGIFAFLLVYYLHYQGADLALWVTWTLPRVSMTALSAALLSAAVVSGEG